MTEVTARSIRSGDKVKVAFTDENIKELQERYKKFNETATIPFDTFEEFLVTVVSMWY